MKIMSTTRVNGSESLALGYRVIGKFVNTLRLPTTIGNRLILIWKALFVKQKHW